MELLLLELQNEISDFQISIEPGLAPKYSSYVNAFTKKNSADLRSTTEAVRWSVPYDLSVYK